MATQQELQDWLIANGVNNAGIPIGTSPSSNLSVYENVLALSQNPTFLLQQGFVTPEEMLKYVQSAINEPVLRPQDYDVEGYRATVPTSNTILSGAFDLIDQGMTPTQVIAKIYGDIAEQRGGDTTNLDEKQVQQYATDIEEYYRRVQNANEMNSRIASGEWFRDPSGAILGIRDDARQVLSSLDFGGIAGVPQMWQPILDPEMLALAQQQLADAEEARQSWTTKGRQAAKETQAAAQKAYMDFISQAQPQSGGSAVISRGGRGPQTLRTRADILANEDGKIPLRSRADILAEQQGNKDGRVTIDYGRNRSATVRTSGPMEGDSNEAIISRLTPQEQDYWAKMAASYGGRAAQESSSTQRQAAEERERAGKLFTQSQESAQSAIDRARTPALEALMQMPSIAAMIAQPTSKPAYVKPKPRTLSDEEIEIMSTMIAGGMK